MPGSIVYNTLIVALALVATPLAGLVCLVRPAWRQGLGARLGVGWPSFDRGRPVLWAHAASVGEMEGIAPLVRRWQEENPRGETVVTALTATGCTTARRLLPGAHVLTFPIDLPWITRSVTRRVRPSLFIFSENEIWPNAIWALDRLGVPIVQVSGRLSPGAARAYSRFPRLVRSVIGRVTCFCVQSEDHRGRLCALGVDPRRVVVTGSLKGEGEPPPPPAFLTAASLADRPIIVAGSTHSGEEAVLVSAIARLAAEAVPARSPVAPLWIIAPRHPERFAEVAALLEREGVSFVRRTALGADPGDDLDAVAVLLLDTLGELPGCYAPALAAFIGGSLVPIGGHNLLEAARWGVPIVVGPYLDSVASLAESLRREGALHVVGDAAELAAALATFLDPDVRAAASRSARAIAVAEGGGLTATWAAVNRTIAPQVAA